ncbi:MAG: HAMP domain-containing sensor histidine kinase [Myxococcota bacterium]
MAPPGHGSFSAQPRLEAQLRAERFDQEIFLNRLRSGVWLAVGLLLFAAGLQAGSMDPLAIISITYAVVCFLVWSPLIRRAWTLDFLPSFLVLVDVGILILSGFWVGPEALTGGVLQGLLGGMLLILCTGALRLDWVPCAVGGVAAVAGVFGLRAAYEPFDLYHLVNPLMVAGVVGVLCLGIRRTRSFAEHLFDEVHNTQEQRTMVMGQLVAGVAHEMNTPLGALRSSLATMGRAMDKVEGVPDKTSRVFSSSAANAHAALERIDEFLNRLQPFASLDAPSREEVSLQTLLPSVVELEQGVKASGATLNLDVRDDAVVLGNSAQLGLVFLNLLRNATDAAGAGGRVEVSSEVEAKRVLIRIADDGPGMTDEAMARAFAPSFSNQSGRVKLGLGLAVARGIVQQHDGRLELARGDEGGTVVRVELPLFSPELPSAEERTRSAVEVGDGFGHSAPQRS